MDVRCFTVGPLQENCWLVRREGAREALIVDPGDEAPRLLRALDDLGVALAGILVTHTHFDHVGAVAEVARSTGAEVWVPEGEHGVLADLNAYVAWPGFGPFESYDAEHDVRDGDVLELAGLRIDVVLTPGHSPGHVSYVVGDEGVLLSGDVLFRGSVGRTDLPGGDWPTLLASIGTLVERLPADTTVYPGHMGVTSLGAERAANPFLQALTRR
jgi:glyoxylase-like metal-dependent hydrolase (beta-lactamase superfamily II)